MLIKVIIIYLLTLVLAFFVFGFSPKNTSDGQTKIGGKMIKLPTPNYQGITVEEAIKKRRSVRSFSKKSLSLLQLSQLLFSAQGITGTRYGHELRAAPSAGALYPLEIYLVVHRVEELSPGIYYYNVAQHSLELLKAGDFRKEITNAALGQEMLAEAKVVFIFSAVFQRTQNK
ncbi:MAG: SagB/ThcOx family dehydrogenase, partial [Desulfobacterota bacterium]|nr:SagB/ThcOx family dehydrogenase [Thermodesulfobacteriota bacterium]